MEQGLGSVFDRWVICVDVHVIVYCLLVDLPGLRQQRPPAHEQRVEAEGHVDAQEEEERRHEDLVELFDICMSIYVYIYIYV